MKSKYTLVAGQKPMPDTCNQFNPAGEIIEGITSLERHIAAWRREQCELEQQIERQRVWLEENRDHELYAQRLAIHEDRNRQWDELNRKITTSLIDQQHRIDTLEGRDREMAIARLLLWTEPPF